jgi:hypothetical protein
MPAEIFKRFMGHCFFFRTQMTQMARISANDTKPPVIATARNEAGSNPAKTIYYGLLQASPSQ